MCVCVRVSVRVRVRLYVCTRVRVYACTRVRVYACTRVRVCVGRVQSKCWPETRSALMISLLFITVVELIRKKDWLKIHTPETIVHR